ncbi:hypothetical protein [Sinorhizobium mexicanum]|uniref:Uncharacterized protein n=1 Tax=Sinorhizobium mexicanum TaxID=375549 RepID=A0A859R405_9HYPH|nr:hypothetical protein [Sinorhizobium mexicanum]MBP1884775.1 hypothetical protein [Sinorhizobium mexicanum]QLL65651.1 hypothetical protein FKV68_30600 [Sinorhizobium mexicanum]
MFYKSLITFASLAAILFRAEPCMGEDHPETPITLLEETISQYAPIVADTFSVVDNNDLVVVHEGTRDDRGTIQAAWNAAAGNRGAVLMKEPLRPRGQLTLRSDLHVQWLHGAYTYFDGFSRTGSLIQNLDPDSSSPRSIVSNITLENPQLDGSFYPSPVELEVLSSTSNTVTFRANASAVDGFYVGLCLEDTGGANGGGLRIVTHYDGSTRTATHSTPWSRNPPAGTRILAGWNDNLIGVAAGAGHLRIIGGSMRNLAAEKMVPSGTGGKGVSGEQGVVDLNVIGTSFDGVHNPLFAQGVEGTFANGERKRAVVRWENIYAKNGGSLLTAAGINSTADPDGDTNDSVIIANNIKYENFGHSPHRIVRGDRQKSGIINFLEAQNVSISNVRGRNDPSYPSTSPGYPTDYRTRVGYGLTGSVGAMIWGWGRNLSINSFVHHGKVDNVVVVRRGRALGDDAGPTGAPQNCFNWSFKGIEHHGVINEYIVRIDPNPSLRVAADELTGEMEIAVDGNVLTGGLIDPSMAAFANLTLTLTDRVGGKTVIGTPQQILAVGNTFASYSAGLTDLRLK